MAKNSYSVVVGNIGNVHAGTNKRAALATFAEYVRQSKTGRGRAGAESVILFVTSHNEFGPVDGILREYVPAQNSSGDV